MVKKETPASGKLLLSLKVTGSPSEFTKRLNTQTFWHQSKGKLHDEVGAKLLPTAHCRSLWSITWCSTIPRSNSSRRTRSKEAADSCSAQKLLACFRYAQYDIKTRTSQTVEADTGIDFEALRRRVLTYSEFILCSYLIMIFYIILHIVLIYNICCISYHIILHHLFFSKTLFPNMTTTITTVESTVS